jgi:TPR repeat protein
MEKKKAIIVGINEYDDPGFENLKYAESDAHAIYDVLSNPDIGGFSKDDIVLLTGKSKSDVEESLETVLDEAKRDDMVFVYFAGHGKLDKTGELCLAARNTKVNRLLSSSIHLGQIHRLVKHSDCRRIVIVIDSCFSGAVGQSFRSGGAPTDVLEQISGQGIVTISASQQYERARERDDVGHGIFTHSFLTGLEKGDADQDNDGYVSIDELYRYIYTRVTADTRGQQVPMKWGMDEKGDIIIAKSIKTLNAKRAEVERLSKEVRDLELDSDTNLDKAMAVWNEILRLEPQNANAQSEIKKIQEEKKRKAEVEAKIEKLLGWYKRNQITGSIYDKAVRLIGKSDSSLNDNEKICARLVADLLNDYLTIENFTKTWARIDKAEHETPSDNVSREERPVRPETAQQSEGRLQENADFSEKPRPESDEEAYVKADECYRNGDYKSALAFFRKTAEAGNVKAMTYLGVMYEKGQGVKTNYAHAIQWYQKAADFGDPRAMNNLASMYEDGHGLTRDYAKAINWYGKAASLGYERAMSSLERLEEQQRPKEQSKESRKRTSTDFPDGSSDAFVDPREREFVKGDEYYRLGDYKSALLSFQKSATCGNAKAMTYLGVMYDKGQGVEQSSINAVSWYTKAAEGGDPAGMTNLGVVYERSMDYGEAMRWYRQAASLGHELAGESLRRLERTDAARARLNQGIIGSKGHSTRPSNKVWVIGSITLLTLFLFIYQCSQEAKEEPAPPPPPPPPAAYEPAPNPDSIEEILKRR